MAAVLPFVPYIAAAAGAAINTISGKQVEQRQKNDYLEGLRQQKQSRDQAGAQVDALTGQLAASNPDQFRIADKNNFLAELQAHAAGINGIPTVAGANPRYAQDTARANDATHEYSTTLADLLSRMDSPAQQRAVEGYRASRTATNLNRISSFAEGNQRIAEMKAAGERQNPWIAMLAQGLMNAGSGQYGTAMKKAPTGYGGTTVTGQPIEAGIASGAGNYSPASLTAGGVFS